MTNSTDPYLPLRPQAATEADEICRCEQGTPVLLQPNLSRNPLSCCRCNLEAPPERFDFDGRRSIHWHHGATFTIPSTTYGSIQANSKAGRRLSCETHRVQSTPVGLISRAGWPR